MSEQIVLYLKKRYQKGKSRAAYAIDLVLSRLILFVALFLLFWYLTFHSVVALILSAMVTAIFTIISHTLYIRKFEIFAKEEYAKLRDKYILEQILMLNSRDLNVYVQKLFHLYTRSGSLERLYGGYYDREQGLFCYMLDNHPTNPVSAQQMLTLFRVVKRVSAKKYILLTASRFSDEARIFLASFLLNMNVSSNRIWFSSPLPLNSYRMNRR